MKMTASGAGKARYSYTLDHLNVGSLHMGGG